MPKNRRFGSGRSGSLVLGHWAFVGHWGLVIGDFRPHPSPVSFSLICCCARFLAAMSPPMCVPAPPPVPPLGSIFLGGGGMGLLVAPPTTWEMSPSTPALAWNLALGSGRPTGGGWGLPAAPAVVLAPAPTAAPVSAVRNLVSTTSSRTRLSASRVGALSTRRVS